MHKTAFRGFLRFLGYAVLIVVCASAFAAAGAEPVRWYSRGLGGYGDSRFVAFDPVVGSVMYVGGNIGGLFKSVDGGEHWL